MKRLSAIILLPLALATYALDGDHQEKALASLGKGAEYLLTTQQDDGAWPPMPRTAIAALCVTALHDAPIDAVERDAAIDRAMAFILQQTGEDGSVRSEPQRHYLFFSDAGYPTYTTAVALLAMATLQRPEDVPYMRQAREFLRNVQVTEEGERFGGFGYKPGSRPDMSNTAWVAEAMYYSAYVEQESPEVTETTRQQTQAMWEQLDTFLQQTQNPPADESETAGGFGYRPGMVSSGSMSYAGLKSMIYANVDRQDPRVKGALAYLKEHYSVQENPGQGTRGLYYYLQTMSKALDLLDQDVFILDDGEKRQWRHDLIDKLVAAQDEDGSWHNEDGRYMESIEPLVTAYAMITLKRALRPLAEGETLPERPPEP